MTFICESKGGEKKENQHRESPDYRVYILKKIRHISQSVLYKFEKTIIIVMILYCITEKDMILWHKI